MGASREGDGIRAYTLPQVPNGRSVVDKVAPAFVKLFLKEETSEIAGAVIIGEAATEIIHEMALAVENGLTLQQWATRFMRTRPTPKTFYMLYRVVDKILGGILLS
nr:hypothetical protein [Geoanaerobacter pelophilus]